MAEGDVIPQSFTHGSPRKALSGSRRGLQATS